MFNNRVDMLSIISPGGTYCEIGTLDGVFSKVIFDKLSPKNLVLIDLFQGTCGSGDQDGNNYKEYDLNFSYQELSSFFAEKPVKLLKGDSSSMLYTFDDNTFDMIYIDGDHRYEGCRKDLEVAYKKCKSGGFIMGHDYEMNMSKAKTYYNFGVKQAVDEFCDKYKQNITYKAMDGCVSYAIKLNK